jgi:hypothetical protein
VLGVVLEFGASAYNGTDLFSCYLFSRSISQPRQNSLRFLLGVLLKLLQRVGLLTSHDQVIDAGLGSAYCFARWPLSGRMSYMPRIPLNTVVQGLLFFTAFSIGGTAVAGEDQNKLLEGDFAFTETRVCQQFGGLVTAIVYGTYTYNGDGTGSVKGTNGPGNNTIEGVFVYTVNPNRSFTQSFGTLNLTFVATGITGTITGIETGGQIAAGQKVLVLGHLNQNPETVITGSNPPFTRNCIRSGSGAKIIGPES